MQGDASSFAPLELRDRAVAFLSERGPASEDEVLAHVYGGPAPSTLRARMAAPLLADPRLEQRSDGRWTIRGANPVTAAAFTTLAVVATGPTPGRARVVRVSALHVDADAVVGRFDVTLEGRQDCLGRRRHLADGVAAVIVETFRPQESRPGFRFITVTPSLSR